MPQSYYALRGEEDGSWSVVDLANDEPARVKNRSLAGLSKQDAYDAIRLLAIIEQLRRGTAPALGPDSDPGGTGSGEDENGTENEGEEDAA